MNKARKFALPALAALALLGASGASAQSPKLKIGCLTKTSSNPFFLTMIEGCRQAAQKYNLDVVIGSTPTEGADAEQLAILETWLNQGGFAGFVVTPFRATSLNSALRKASARGIPIVNIDELIPPDSAQKDNIKLAQQIASDNQMAGAVVAQEMAKVLPKGAEVAVVEGPAGVTSSLDRVGGFKKAAQAAGLKIVASQPADWDRSRAFNVASNILQSNPNVKGFFAANDGMALGVLRAVQSGNKTIPVYGVDATPEALQSVKNGALSGTVQQHPDEMSLKAVETLLQLIKDKNARVPTTLKTSVTLVNKANVDAVLSGTKR